MWQVYVFGFLAGLIAVNGVPSFIKGLSGKKHMTPFGADSSAHMNVFWGWLNFVVAGILVYYSHYHSHLLRAFACVAVGALVAGLLISTLQAKMPAKR